jgi:hypothetical protein
MEIEVSGFEGLVVLVPIRRLEVTCNASSSPLRLHPTTLLTQPHARSPPGRPTASSSFHHTDLSVEDAAGLLVSQYIVGGAEKLEISGDVGIVRAFVGVAQP